MLTQRTFIHRCCYLLAVLAIFILSVPSMAQAGVIVGKTTLVGGARWDAAPRTFSGLERSLDGDLRYSVSGGSYQALRDSFTWSSTPTVNQFQTAVEQSFAAWRSVDPVSGLGTALSFRSDFGTAVVTGNGFGTLDFAGAEIDVLASDAGDSGLRGFTTLSTLATPVTLTSGVANYAGSWAIRGSDVHINNNAGAVYTLDAFRRVLTHELGHALGYLDVYLGGSFIDDNYDPLDAIGTLTNSWTHLVNPLDPANSAGLSVFSVPPSDFTLSGVDILMESFGLGVGPGNPLSNLVPLTNDEYGTRQFLYPETTTIPEPGSIALIAIGVMVGLGRRRKR